MLENSTPKIYSTFLVLRHVTFHLKQLFHTKSTYRSQVHLLRVPCEHKHLKFHILTLTQPTKQADFSCLQYHAVPEVFRSSNTKILLLTMTPNNIQQFQILSLNLYRSIFFMCKFLFKEASRTALQNHFNMYHRTEIICIFGCVIGLFLVVQYKSILQTMLHGAYF